MATNSRWRMLIACGFFMAAVSLILITIWHLEVTNSAAQRLGSINMTTANDSLQSSTEECVEQNELSILECRNLVKFFHSTNGDSWHNSTNWLGTTSPCSWYGITCGNGHVVEIYLPGNNLSGQLPEALSSLAHLEFFDVSNNQIEGSIPIDLATMQNLEQISFHGNGFSGKLPESLEKLRNLTVFDVGDTEICVDIFAANVDAWMDELASQDILLREDLANNCKVLSLEDSLYLPLIQ